ncbi:MAG: hypothetical protein II391_04375, partial [Kiritimatiellae bacterium]|nr:hypothetical protein [Kiritimatiellia bacterium]
MTTGMFLAVIAATHFSSIEGEKWKSFPLEAVASNDGALELFATDGKTPRAGSVPWRAWGTTFNELDLDALRMLKPAEQ